MISATEGSFEWHKSGTKTNLFHYLNVVIQQKRKDFTGLSLSCLTFQIFSQGNCLAVAQVLIQISVSSLCNSVAYKKSTCTDRWISEDLFFIRLQNLTFTNQNQIKGSRVESIDGVHTLNVFQSFIFSCIRTLSSKLRPGRFGLKGTLLSFS